VLLLVVPSCGCSREKSTADLLADLKGSTEREKLIAVRLLPARKGDAAQIVPALIEALKDKDGDIRRSAAIGLGGFGADAREAIPALQAARRDRDARVQEAARVAIARIDPQAK
jgi:HEAT repeat protein